MKRLFFSVAMCCLLGIPNASALENLCNRWNILYDNEDAEGPDNATYWTDGYKLQGDTLINGLTYERVLLASGYNKKSADDWTWLYYGCVRETANAEVFFIPKNSSKEGLLFAFNAQKDDTFNPFVSEESFTVWLKVKEVSEKEIVLDMYGTKDDVNPRQQITWIKGVGMNFGLFMPYNYFMMEGMSFGALLCAYNGEEQVYMSPAGETYGCEYWREPAEGIENHSVAEFQEGRIYNLLGIEVPDSYNGIVIQNGKKELKLER
ncbi:MAG: hypothetical protein J5875_02655 [Paludibacteraceae bacterium]|nr:hypothetical protein [Paludibacteraceae bacterium]